MYIFQKLIFKQLIKYSLLICCISTGVIFLSQALKLVYLLSKGISIATFTFLVLMSLPSLLLTVIPISLFLGTIFYFFKIKNDYELIVIENSGLNYLQIAKPAIYVSLIATMICYSISLYILPWSYGKLKNHLNIAKENFAINLITPKTFNNITKNVIIYVNEKFNDNTLKNVIIFDNRQTNEPVIITTNLVKILNEDSNLNLHLIKGNRQVKHSLNNIDIAEFNELIINIPIKKINQIRSNTDIQEKHLIELLNPQSNEVSFSKKNKFRAEAHQRLSWPMLCVVLPMIVLATMITADYQRRVSYLPVFIASFISIIVVLTQLTITNKAVFIPSINYLIYFNLVTISFICYTILANIKFKNTIAALFDKIKLN